MTEQAYLIDAAARTITMFEHENFEGLIAHLPGGLTLGARFPNGDLLYLDDMGLLEPATKAFRLKSRKDGQPFMSNGVLKGMNDMDEHGRESCLPPRFSIAELQAEIEWLTVEQALNWFRAMESETALSINGQPVATWTGYLAMLEGRETPD